MISNGISHFRSLCEKVKSVVKTRQNLDRWLLDALQFFIKRRNLIVHEGKVERIQSAIDIGTTVLAKLNEIR